MSDGKVARVFSVGTLSNFSRVEYASGKEYKAVAVHFVAPANRAGNFATVQYDGAGGSRQIVISTEPGVFTGSPSCTTSYKTEASRYWTSASSGLGCPLVSGQSYYINIRDQTSCSTDNNPACRFTMNNSM